MFEKMRGVSVAVYGLAGGCQEIGKTSCIEGDLSTFYRYFRKTLLSENCMLLAWEHLEVEDVTLPGSIAILRISLS